MAAIRGDIERVCDQAEPCFFHIRPDHIIQPMQRPGSKRLMTNWRHTQFPEAIGNRQTGGCVSQAQARICADEQDRYTRIDVIKGAVMHGHRSEAV